MAKKVIFFFSGTAETAQQAQHVNEDDSFDKDVIRVYFTGCQNKAVGGSPLYLGLISPNLDTVARQIRETFDDKGQLSLSQLKKKFGKAIIIEPQDSECDKVEVESINLTGYSRGAVTTFAVARHLDDVGKPIRLFAEDPVPGTSKNRAKKTSSEFFKNHDLRECKNLVEAQVIIGSYKKNVNPLHNKFFRQMAPLFGDNCNSSIYTVPKSHHWHFSHKSENQRTEFLINGGIKGDNAFFHKENDDRMTFTPKIIQQKHHIGTSGQLEILPRYKTALFNLVFPSCNISRNSSIKSAQSLYALQLAPSFAHKDSLVSVVRNDTTLKGKAIREFIVEFENINQYVFRKPYSLVPILRNDPSLRGRAIKKIVSMTEKINQRLFRKRKTIDKQSLDAMNLFKSNVYELLHNFPIEHATPTQKKEFVSHIQNRLKEIKSNLPSKQYNNLNELMNLFLKENMIFHLDLAQYIDETETFNSGPKIKKTGEQAMATIRTAKTGTDMAEILYHMSENSRKCAYDQFPQELHKVITDTKQLEDVMRFLPIKHIEKIFKNKGMRNLIKNVDDLNSIMNKMFYPAHQKAIYHAMKSNIKTMNLNFTGLGELMQHLSSAECKNLITSIKFHNIKKSSTKDITAFFEKLNDQQFNKVFPKMAQEIAYYLDRNISTDNGNDLLNYLGNRITDQKVRGVFDRVFPNVKSITQSFKQRQAMLKESLEDTKVHSTKTPHQ